MSIVVENEHLYAEFDGRTGAMTRLTGKDTGWDIQRRPELGLSFSMLLPLPDRRNNQINGNDQDAPQIERPDESSVVLTWRLLKDEHGGEHDITFKGRVELSDGQLAFTAELDNRSDYTIETVSWPCIGDFSRPAGTKKLESIWLYYNLMLRGEMFPNFLCQVGYWGVDYPTQISPSSSCGTPFYLVENGSEGLYMGYHDQPVSRMLLFTFQLKPGWEFTDTNRCGTVPTGDELYGEPVRIEFQAVHFPYCNAGEEQSLSPVVLAPYTGTWHKGVDHYKAWRQTWFRRPPMPEWVRQPHAWHQIHINSPEDELRCRYTDLVRYAEAARRHGVTAIQLVGWTTGGQDRGNPSHDIDPRLGTREELAAAIAKCQELGVRIVLFSKFTWADQSQPWYREEGGRHVARDCYGNPYPASGYQYQTWPQLAQINTRPLVPLCHASPALRELMVEEFKKMIDLRPDGTLCDESQHHYLANYCFDPDHGHRQPAYNHLGDRLLVDAFKEVSESVDPDFLYAGEGIYDQQFLAYHLSYFRSDGLDSNVLARYIDPQAGLMMAVCGYRDRNNINFALMYRMIVSHEPRLYKGELDEYPETVAYGGLMEALRRRYQDRLWDAEYRDVLGASVAVDGQPHKHYSVFVTPEGKRAVVVCNFDLENARHFRIDLTPGPSGDLVIVSPESPEPRACPGGEVELPARSVIVLIEG
ncbi:MAG: DUF6259 domain-containing protein [Lentisphaeria bacterium]|nr:DUF6259 domain-containing protein [Lentisphaeria bacterium]